MAKKRPKGVSPTLSLHITEENVADAVQSNSGACLIADAIKREYPNLSSVMVDMATIRATDRTRGERYTYLTPPAAQHVLLSFDQGWPNPVTELTVRAAVQVMPIRAGSRAQVQRRAERKRTLEKAEQQGLPLAPREREALVKMREADEIHEPRTNTSYVPPEVVDRGPRATPVVVGGRPAPLGEPHPNLLRGRNRIYGAKLADPGQAFKEAVAEAAADLVAQQGTAAPADPQQGSDAGTAAGGA